MPLAYRYIMSRKPTKSSTKYNKLLKNALKNPGIHEVTKLYENYNKISKQISAISASIKPRSTIITSNSTN